MAKKQSTSSKKPELEHIRHSLSHILAAAVLRIFPDAKLGIGPAIDNGFYYDLDLPRPLNEDDLKVIEKEMRDIMKKDVAFEIEEVAVAEAKKRSKNQEFKLDLIKEFSEDAKTITYVKSGEFTDLCKGGHIENTKQIPKDAFMLSHVSGAYWRGSEKNPMLQRIYGFSFGNKKDLKAYLKQREEAEKRDHRKLGKELGLFMIEGEELGPGLPVWLPYGATVREELESYVNKLYRKNKYQVVRTPHVGHVNLWRTSGHWAFYRENMFPHMDIEDEQYIVKPMSCPMHIKIFQQTQHSYRELPLRLAEIASVYRFERSGVLHGLLRVRGFTQDDAHIFVSEDTFAKELDQLILLVKETLEDFGFSKYKAFLSVRGEKNKAKYVGDNTNWDIAEQALEDALRRSGMEFQIDKDEAKFYGPAIDVKIEDAIGREWQLSTIQVDFNLPHRFKVKYIDSDGVEKEPIMLHRALLGSLERFFAVLVEHYAGAFPLWLAPVQVKVVSVGEDYNSFAEELAEIFESEGIRAEADTSDNTVSYKVRNATKMKSPYVLVVGEKEASGKDLMVRKRGEAKPSNIEREQLIAQIHDEIGHKVIF